MAKRVLFTASFWLAAFERAVKTFAQALATTLGMGAVDVLSVPWEASLSLAAGAALASVLTSIASAKVGTAGPSLGAESLPGRR